MSPTHHHLKRKESNNSLKKKFDVMAYIVSIIGPVMTLPQIFIIWENRDAEGVSLISWSTYFATSLFFVLYGYIHKEKIIIFTNILWVVVNGLVVLGVLFFNNQ